MAKVPEATADDILKLLTKQSCPVLEGKENGRHLITGDASRKDYVFFYDRTADCSGTVKIITPELLMETYYQYRFQLCGETEGNLRSERSRGSSNYARLQIVDFPITGRAAFSFMKRHK